MEDSVWEQEKQGFYEIYPKHPVSIGRWPHRIQLYPSEIDETHASPHFHLLTRNMPVSCCFFLLSLRKLLSRYRQSGNVSNTPRGKENRNKNEFDKSLRDSLNSRLFCLLILEGGERGLDLDALIQPKGRREDNDCPSRKTKP